MSVPKQSCFEDIRRLLFVVEHEPNVLFVGGEVNFSLFFCQHRKCGENFFPERFHGLSNYGCQGDIVGGFDGVGRCNHPVQRTVLHRRHTEFRAHVAGHDFVVDAKSFSGIVQSVEYVNIEVC